jgi:hypothetical protein
MKNNDPTNYPELPTEETATPSNNGEANRVTDKLETPTDGLNPYRPEDLWIDLDKIHSGGAVKRLITTVPIRKPNKHEFFRVRAGQEFWKPVAMIELEREQYLIHPSMVPHMDPDDFYRAYLCSAISKSGILFFWPVKLPKDGRTNAWNESALVVAKQAIDSWAKLRSRQEDGRGGGFYEAEIPLANFGEPLWPELSLHELFSIAFKGDRIIDRVDHMVIQKLTGQIK